MRKCNGCFHDKEMYRGKYCQDCYNEREARRYLENKLKNEPWRYVECSECPKIWVLKKKKIGEAGFRTERYRRSKCPDCNSHALCFIGTGRSTLNTEKLKRSVK
jgi:hypothetical protein